MLGLEELWCDLAEYFHTKIYVDKKAIPEYYADMEIVAPELLTDDPQTTRFHICKGSPYLYQRAKIKFMQARTKRMPHPLFIRPSAQYYTFEERLEGAGCGMILGGDCARSSRQRRLLRVPKAAERDEHGIWHVCYSIHSCRSELERAMEILWPKEVISTTPHCHASEVMSERADLFLVDVHSRNVQVLEVQQQKELGDAAKKHDVKLLCEASSSAAISEARMKASKDIASSDVSGGRKKVCLDLMPKKDYLAQDFAAAVVPLFGMARHSIPPSPPLSFSTDSLENQDFEDLQSSVECFPNGCCKKCPEEPREAGFRDTFLERTHGDTQQGCSSGDCTDLGVFVNPAVDAAESLSKEKTHNVEVTVHGECKHCELDSKLAGKENMVSSMATFEGKQSPRSHSHRPGENGFIESTRQLYKSFFVPIPSDLPSLSDLYGSL